MSETKFDQIAGKVVPESFLHKLPWFVSRFLGYRNPERSSPEPPVPAWENNLWIFLSTMAGLISNMAIFKYGSTFVDRDVGLIEPNWGASAILIYNSIGVPLAQPRNVFFGTILSSLIGVALPKIFLTNPDNEQYLWLSGALATSISSVLMSVFNIVHPPAGAAALIPSVVSAATELGWYYLALQTLSAVVMLGVALLMNNIRRVYPVYWWSPKQKT